MKKIALLLLISLIAGASAASWSGSVSTNTGSWSIYRQSEGLIFNYSQSVQGTVSPIDYHGRTLGSYYSGYQEIDENDVRHRARTSAFQGSYSSEELTSLRSEVCNPVYMNITKPAGSPVYTIDYFEQWPVILKSSKSVKYSGTEINDREFAGNNLDFAGSDLLYNKELSKETNVGLLLKRMNATVLATDNAILSAEFMPLNEMDYRIKTYTTGIADLKYRQTGSSYNTRRESYPAVNEGEERYYGTYNITRHIHMNSDFENYTLTYDWLPCISCGWNDMTIHDQRYHSAKDFFDFTACPFPYCKPKNRVG
jgi:hypothetical protein